MQNHHLWRNPSLFALVVWLLTVTYSSVYRDALDISTVSESLAFTGGMLFGCSFGIGIMAHFFNFLDNTMKYRREIGLLGYFFALGHALTLLLRFPDTYIESFPDWMAEPASMLGLGAMSIFTLMAMISFRPGMRLVGRHFRPILRLGYLAYAMLIARAWIIQKDTWLAWFDTGDGLAPPRFVLTLFALTVIAARIVMEVSLRMRRETVESTN